MRALTPIAATVLATMGGVFFGLFSCGGYIWHRQAFFPILGGLLALTCIAPPTSLRSATRRATFVIGTIALFSRRASSGVSVLPVEPRFLRVVQEANACLPAVRTLMTNSFRNEFVE